MKRLLVIRFSALGDVAMVVPVLRALGEQYPDWDITMASKKHCASLFQNLPPNVHFFPVDTHGRHKGLSGLNRLMHDLDYRHLDAVADLHDVLRSQYMRQKCLWRGKRVAHIHKDRFQKWLLVRHFYLNKHPLTSTVVRYKMVFEELGFDLSLPKHLALTTSVKHNIGIAPFAAHKGKIYPLDEMEQVVATLGEKMQRYGEHVYLFGAGKEEAAILDQWADKYDGVESLVGQMNMSEELKFMSRLRLMLTMDSSNMHLASLVGTRVLSIWGATHPWAGFLGFGQREDDCIQQSIPCRPCSIYGNRRCKYGDYRCLQISKETIIERVLGAIVADLSVAHTTETND